MIFAVHEQPLETNRSAKGSPMDNVTVHAHNQFSGDLDSFSYA